MFDNYEWISVTTGQLTSSKSMLKAVSSCGRGTKEVNYWGDSFTCPDCGCMWAICPDGGLGDRTDHCSTAKCKNPECKPKENK